MLYFKDSHGIVGSDRRALVRRKGPGIGQGASRIINLVGPIGAKHHPVSADDGNQILQRPSIIGNAIVINMTQVVRWFLCHLPALGQLDFVAFFEAAHQVRQGSAAVGCD